jgi:hypothetical protein
LGARKHGQETQLGVKLFILYSTVSRIYVLGVQIVECIEKIVETGHLDERTEQYGNSSRQLLTSLVEEQAVNLYDLEREFHSLSNVVDIFDPDVSRRMSLYMDSKNQIISFLQREMQGWRRDRRDEFETYKDWRIRARA